jgi:hypothetical protein
VDVDHASVSVTGVTITSAIPASSVRAALGRVPLLRCYQDALRARGSPAGGAATLRLKIDVAGYVTAASLENAHFLPAMKGCVEQAARRMRVKDVDTGEATAAVALTFVSSP